MGQACSFNQLRFFNGGHYGANICVIWGIKITGGIILDYLIGVPPVLVNKFILEPAKFEVLGKWHYHGVADQCLGWYP